VTRPEIPINWNKVEELLMAGAPGTEVAAFLGMHPNTFYRRVEEKFNTSFSDYSAQKKSIGEVLLRLQQFNKALGNTQKGDNTLLIFLGKQRLGQRENPNDKVAPEEIIKAFNELMKQIDTIQAERSQQKTISQESSISTPSFGVNNPVSVF
jgi:AraC-like DNA-binding protein